MNSGQTCGLNRNTAGHATSGFHASTILTFLFLLAMTAFAHADINDGLVLNYPGCSALEVEPGIRTGR
ncbi:MAG: hypothetical protein KGZ62_06120 [Sulfurimonas sp.]|nr:hypothetical protein [Sulfurimonas sp.]